MTPTTICNLALDAVPSGRIVSLDENSLQAKICRLHYPQVLAELLEAANWNFARSRVSLAGSINPLETDWSYAYQLPSNFAFPISVHFPPTAGANVIHQGWTANQDGPIDLTARAAPMRPIPYAISGDRLFTHIPGAMLEYVADDVLTAATSALFRKALVLKLAAAISMPITKDPARKIALLQEAEVAEQRALANNFNQQSQTYGDFIPDAVVAQTGMSTAPPIAGISGVDFTMVSPPGNDGTGGSAPPPDTPPPGQPQQPTGPGTVQFPDWSDSFEDQLDF